MKNAKLLLAEEKLFVESKVKYIDPDFTSAQELKAETIEANAKFEAWKADREEAEKIETWTWGG